MRTLIYSLACLAVFAGLGVEPALASKPRLHPFVGKGYDVSYPACSEPLPDERAFGIVGVNDGRANSTNPCLSRELNWAKRSRQLSPQFTAGLYVNTGDPGSLHSSAWPKNNLDPVTRVRAPDPFGRCTGGNHRPCAWQYGWDMASKDAQARGVTEPAAYMWWLDVETENTWESNRQNNRADLGGMVAYLHSIGVTVGVYSTVDQWGLIAGTVTSYSYLYSLPNWIAGAQQLRDAMTACDSPPLTGGSWVALTQWVSSPSRLDGDYACP